MILLSQITTPLFILFFFYQSPAHFDLNCPFTEGEMFACADETKAVESAFNKLKEYSPVVMKVYSYCIDESLVTSRTGLQCRSLSLFFDNNGEVIEDIFIDRFVGHETWRTHLYATYIAKNPETKKYERFVDHVNKGILAVDQHMHKVEVTAGPAINDTDIPVSFDNLTGFPSFTAHYFGQAAKLIFSPSKALLLDINDTLLIDYLAVNKNKPSIGTIETQEQWQSFFEMLGINHTNKH